MSELATNLKKYRTEMNLIQDDLAKELFITRQSVSKYWLSIAIVIVVVSMFLGQ
jgi:transcriptional regulator with XRE-family HTH domain